MVESEQLRKNLRRLMVLSSIRYQLVITRRASLWLGYDDQFELDIQFEKDFLSSVYSLQV